MRLTASVGIIMLLVGGKKKRVERLFVKTSLEDQKQNYIYPKLGPAVRRPPAPETRIFAPISAFRKMYP